MTMFTKVTDYDYKCLLVGGQGAGNASAGVLCYISWHNYLLYEEFVVENATNTGADLGFEKGGGAGGSGASFGEYLGQFRGLFKKFGAKNGWACAPAPPPPLAQRLQSRSQEREKLNRLTNVNK